MKNGSGSDFLSIAALDEMLHPLAANANYTAIETNLYGFNCPQEGIDGELYAWYHPALKVMGFMIYIFKGSNQHQLEAEYFNEYVYLPMIGTNADYRLEMGSCTVHVRVVDPLKEIVVDIDDPSRGLHVHLVTRGAQPPVGRPGGGHFTQLMENRGELRLRGDTYDISGWFIRDRSWAQNRPEHIQPGPPANWMTGWFGGDLAFHASILDTSIIDLPEYGPQWREYFDVEKVIKSMKWESGGETADANLRGGWWQQDGQPRALISVEARTKCGEDAVTPKQVVLDIRDRAGASHHIVGRTLSSIPKMHGQNVLCYICFMEWTYQSRTGYGEMMAVYDSEHLYRLKKLLSPTA